MPDRHLQRRAAMQMHKCRADKELRIVPRAASPGPAARLLRPFTCWRRICSRSRRLRTVPCLRRS
jgi:hypothetical protein